MVAYGTRRRQGGVVSNDEEASKDMMETGTGKTIHRNGMQPLKRGNCCNVTSTIRIREAKKSKKPGKGFTKLGNGSLLLFFSTAVFSFVLRWKKAKFLLSC